MTQLVGSAALAVSLAAISVAVVRTQQPLTPSRAPYPGAAMVRAANMVNLCTSQFPTDPSGFAHASPGAPLQMFTVPNDRYLVVTDWDCLSFLATGATLTGGFLAENRNGVVTPKIDSAFTQDFTIPPASNAQNGWVSMRGPYHSSVGMAFAPGSIVEWRVLPPATTTGLQFHLTGYLAPL